MSENTAAQAQAQENEAMGTAYIVAALGEQELRVKEMGQWRPSYLRALREGDFDTWAAGALHEEDAPLFVDLDATFDEIAAFTAEVMTKAGEEPGKSGGSSKSSKRTRKR
ncbi:hypothetical protein [Streptomyces silvensis]|uniref:Uncharacterized protein n=1 Tax=Streptomyces silvensis TaxID=1765722 RepID=A0A0W7X8J2_9ACTN|nr:hypothetical protein [Streptomyces silvensis]KUF18867.1 hypothetical protein AT728_07485 [Streptomyces silvensis]